MTYEEAINGMKMCKEREDCDGCRYDNSCFGCTELFDSAILEHHDKYKWHDLRKNPEDLPDTTRSVIVAYEDFEEESKRKYYDVAFFGDGNTWYSTEVDNFMFRDGGYDVIAWREIEPFEEVEE